MRNWPSAGDRYCHSGKKRNRSAVVERILGENSSSRPDLRLRQAEAKEGWRTRRGLGNELFQQREPRHPMLRVTKIDQHWERPHRVCMDSGRRPLQAYATQNIRHRPRAARFQPQLGDGNPHHGIGRTMKSGKLRRGTRDKHRNRKRQETNFGGVEPELTHTHTIPRLVFAFPLLRFVRRSQIERQPAVPFYWCANREAHQH